MPGMSSGWPRRPSGIARLRPSWTFCPCGPSRKPASSGVSVGPGHTALSVMPERAISRAIVLVKAMMPPLHAEYTASIDEPTRPASEAMLITRPRRRACMPFSTA